MNRSLTRAYISTHNGVYLQLMGPCWEVLQKPLVIPKWSGTTLKALNLGSPVPMNTFTEEFENEPILEPLPTCQFIMVPICN